MLSDREIQRIREQLNMRISGKARRRLNKKLIEHYYATHLPPFTPLPHHRLYLNRFTNVQTLREIIAVAETSSIFTLDTESVNVFQQPNRPALIQIQILLPDEPSLVLILEANHLPPEPSETFRQIRQLCRIVLDPRKEIFVWGSINELQSFLPFRLFTSEEITSSGNKNFQQRFQEHWQENHVHQLTDCECERCLGKSPTNTWSLQDAVAFQLKEWLDKRSTQSTFDIGLDPRFNTTDPAHRKLREQLSEYASNDCLAIERLLRNMPQQLSRETSPSTTNHFVDTHDIDSESISQQRHIPSTEIFAIEWTTTPPNPIHRSTRTLDRTNTLPDWHEQPDDSPDRPTNRDVRIFRIVSRHQPSEDRSDRRSIRFERPDDRPRRTKYRTRRSEDRSRPEARPRQANVAEDRPRRSEERSRPAERPEGPNDRIIRFERSSRSNDHNDRRKRIDRFHLNDRCEDERHHFADQPEDDRTNDPHDPFKDDQPEDERHHFADQPEDDRTNDPHDQPEDDRTNNPHNQSEDNRRHFADQADDDRPNNHHDRSNRIVRHNGSERNDDQGHRTKQPGHQSERVDRIVRFNPSYRSEQRPHRQTDESQRSHRQIDENQCPRRSEKRSHESNNNCDDRHDRFDYIDRSEDRRDNLTDRFDHTDKHDDRSKQRRSETHRHNLDNQKDRAYQRSERSNRVDRPTIPIVDNEQQHVDDSQRRKIRNRICTRKQRARNYENEIIRRGIDARFSITLIKEILRRYGIPYTALNITRSSITGRTSLYIGFRNQSNLHDYETRTRGLFTTEFFNEFRARNRL